MNTEDTNVPMQTLNETETKPAWVAPVLTKLAVEDAESGINVSENGATGS